jgi:hypothetical protein
MKTPIKLISEGGLSNATDGLGFGCRLLGMVTFVLTTQALAEMNANDFIARYQAGNAAQRAELAQHLSDISLGMNWTNAFMFVNHKFHLYCLPGSLVLTGDELADIVKRFVEKTPNDGIQPVGMILLFALRDAYPCEPASK